MGILRLRSLPSGSAAPSAGWARALTSAELRKLALPNWWITAQVIAVVARLYPPFATYMTTEAPDAYWQGQAIATVARLYPSFATYMTNESPGFYCRAQTITIV